MNGKFETYKLDNGCISVEICNFGGRVVRLFVKDKNGAPVDVVAGFDRPEGYLDDHGTYFGAIIGRVGNRIARGKFELNGKEYTLALNDNGKNHLHGGAEGFDKKFWTVRDRSSDRLVLTYTSKDGEEGYPSEVETTVEYSLIGSALKIQYSAVSDGDTPYSPTNHTYFDLSGKFESILDHEVYINSDALTCVDEELIPHGDLMRSEGTPYDFKTPKEIGRDIGCDSDMLRFANGYDFNYVLGDGELKAYAYCRESGVKMSVYTDRPCMQFYTGNFLDGFVGKRRYPRQSAFCMETQGYPNAVNVPSFESCVLKKGDKFHTYTIYKFSIE